MTAVANILLDWDIGSFLQNAKDRLVEWGGYLIALIGVVLIIVAIYQIAKKFIAPNSAPGGWAAPIIMLLIGGALFAGGWTLVSNIAKGGKKTIEDLGQKKPAASTCWLVPGGYDTDSSIISLDGFNITFPD